MGLQQRGLFRNYTGFPFNVPGIVPGSTELLCNVRNNKLNKKIKFDFGALNQPEKFSLISVN